MSSTLRTAAAAVLFGLLAACHGGRLETPSGFANLDSNDAYSYRATNANGVVLAVRTEPNDAEGNVDFWADALDVRLRNKGYAAESASVAQSTRGLTGKQMHYTIDRGGRAQRYWVTVFATKKKVYVVEAAGDKESFDKAEALVAGAVESLKI